MRETLSLLVVSVLFCLGAVGIFYWLLAYKDAREDKGSSCLRQYGFLCRGY
jgi:hypothetical protein